MVLIAIVIIIVLKHLINAANSYSNNNSSWPCF